MQQLRNLSKTRSATFTKPVLSKLETGKKLSVTNLMRLHFCPYKLHQQGNFTDYFVFSSL